MSPPPMGAMRGRGKAFEKPKNFRGTWARLLKYMGKSLPMLILMIFCSVGGVIFQILGPDKLKDLTNYVFVGVPHEIGGEYVLFGAINMSAVWQIVFILIAFYTISFVLNIIHSIIMPFIAAGVVRRMRGQISKKINRLPIGYFNKNPYGDVLSRISNDCDTIGQTLTQSISSIISATVLFFGVLIMMFYTSWQMATGAVLSSLIGFALMTIIMKSSTKYFAQNQKNIGEMHANVEEVFTGHATVTAYNGWQKSEAEFGRINENIRKSSWKAHFFGGLMMPIMAFVGNMGYVVVCVIGAILATKDPTYIGVIAAFMIYIRLFTQPLQTFAQAGQNIMQTAAAAERVFEFLGETEMPIETNKAELKNIRGEVEFKNCRFGYEEGKPIIKNFSVKVKAGQKVAIVGPTGAGKTTIVNLLMRFFELWDGEILIDGIKTTDITRETVHEQFCMVLQDTWLFNGTIKENIIYALDGITDEQVVKACETVGLDHIIRSMPNGYDTILNENSTLSAGEAQLLTIARAIIKNAPLLILDEATSNVDTRTELIVQRAMDKLMHNRTSFVIAHRLSTIQNADIILVMRNGDIVETGKHKELLDKGGFYAQLYNSQFDEGEHT